MAKTTYFKLAKSLRAQLTGSFNKPINLEHYYELHEQDLKQARLLCSRAKRLSTLCIAEANGVRTRDNQNRTNNAKYSIANLLASYNIHTVQFCEDPRGYSVKLINLPYPDHWLFRDFGGCFVVPYSEDLPKI